MTGRGVLLPALLMAVAGCGGESRQDPTTPRAAVVVWSEAAGFPWAPVLAAYARASGVPIEIVSEGEEPPARTDLVLTSDAGTWWWLDEEGGLRPAYSDVLQANVPAPLRDPDSTWFGVSWNPLVIAYAPGSIDAPAPRDYAGLADERWRGRLCLASSGLAMNRLLLSSLIAATGAAATERVARGWVANLAERPFDTVEALLAAVAAGRCEVAIADAGSVAGLRAIEAVAPATAGGAFGMVTAAGVTRHATNPDGAAALLEWLTGEAAQAVVAAESRALPVNPRVPARMPVPGSMLTEPFAAVLGASRLEAAARLAERAGYR